MNNLTPQLRFPEFTDEWQVKKLCDIFNISAGGDIEKLDFSKNESEAYPYPVYANALTNKGLVGFSAKPKVTTEAITVTGRGDIGHAVARKANFSPVVRLLTLTSRDDYSPYFFECAINSTRLFVESTGVPQLTAPQLGWYKIAYPGIDEQQQIADYLGAIDDKLACIQNKVTAMHEYKKCIMQALFSSKLRFKDENGNPYPDWEEKKLGDIFTFLRTNSLSRAELVDTGEVMNIHYGDIHMKLRTGFDATRDKVSFLSSGIKGDLCQEGDLVIADASEDRTDVGKAVEIMNLDGAKVVSGLHTFLIRPKGLALGFSGYMMQSTNIKEQLWRIATGASVLGISKTELSKLSIRLPSLVEQQKIADFLSALDNKIKVEETKLASAKEFKKALLQRMFV